MNEKKIVFYDGSCGFCNKTVQLILKLEKNQDCEFAAIQSSFAQQFFKNQNIMVDMSTFYFSKNGKVFTKSTGFIELSKEFKKPWNLLIFLKLIPKSIRDFFYDFVAKRRAKIAGNFCYLPNLLEKKRFLNDVNI
jgi:predicted DCC family thiol-disulfide oxidoreductase YuxK